MEGHWEEGLPWLMLLAGEVVQESIGFSPNELVFGHTVRSPLAILSDQGAGPSQEPIRLCELFSS